MRLLSTLLLAMLWLSAAAQETIVPTQRIAEAKAEGKTFTRYRFFEPATPLRTLDFAENCADCAVMRLNAQEVGQLQQQKPDHLTFTLPGTLRSSLEVEVVKTEVLAEGFSVYTASSEGPVEFEEVLFYRGQLKNDTESVVALTVYGQEMRALISSPELGNLALGLHDAETYLLAPDNDNDRPFECATEDTGIPYSAEDLSPRADLRSSNTCTNVYMEVDNDIYQYEGGTNGVMQYVTGFFHEVATLYANENVTIKLSEVFIWDTNSPYNGSDSYTLLQQFQSTRRSFNGDLAQLISYQASGGIAYVDGLCSFSDSYKLSFVSVSPNYRQVPTYSFTVMASAHELGHLFGSQHTHACAWNGNGTAIDGCPGYTEGNCAVPGRPRNGGTIMSYCHITSTGINLSKGFGDQPGNLIRNSVASANCLQVCQTNPPGDGGGGGSGGDDNGGCETMTMTLTLDLFGSETTWELINDRGDVLESGGPYEDKNEGQVITESFCLPNGCYAFTIADARNDGLCCGYGDGSVVLTNEAGTEILRAGQFNASRTREFCIDTGADDDPGNNNGACAAINFNNNRPVSYGGTQDRGRVEVIEGGNGIFLQRNAWKAIDIDYELTANTMITFEFKSDRIGEIHGIGFDNDNRISSTQTLQLYGTQRWGIPNYRNYPGNGEWVRYEIPVGQFLRGRANRLFFVADHDVGSPVGTSYFRNVRLYEQGECTSGIMEERIDLPTMGQVPAGRSEVSVYPNPTSDVLHISLRGLDQHEQQLHIYNLMGQLVKQRTLHLDQEEQVIMLNVRDLPPGTYLYRIGEESAPHAGKFSINR